MQTKVKNSESMRTLRFHTYGEPAKVLKLETCEIPAPPLGRIRVRVDACGLNPADWALCRGLFPGQLPRGIGLDVAGVVDAIGENVVNVAVGDRVFGTADFVGSTSAGAADFTLLDHWARIPNELDMIEASSLPMAIITAHVHLNLFGSISNKTIVIHGAGTVIGYAAVQMALMRGARVIATSGPTFAKNLRSFGALQTLYGEGMVERVKNLSRGVPDFILDTSPPNGVLPDLVKIAGGDPRRVMPITDFEAAKKLGTRYTFEDHDHGKAPDSYDQPSHDILGEFAVLAGAKKFSVPISRTFKLDEWSNALEISLSEKAKGKLVLVLRA